MSHIEENKQDIFFSTFLDIFEIFIMSDLQTEYRYISGNREMFLYLCYEILKYEYNDRLIGLISLLLYHDTYNSLALALMYVQHLLNFQPYKYKHPDPQDLHV